MHPKTLLNNWANPTCATPAHCITSTHHTAWSEQRTGSGQGLPVSISSVMSSRWKRPSLEEATYPSGSLWMIVWPPWAQTQSPRPDTHLSPTMGEIKSLLKNRNEMFTAQQQQRSCNVCEPVMILWWCHILGVIVRAGRTLCVYESKNIFSLCKVPEWLQAGGI